MAQKAEQHQTQHRQNGTRADKFNKTHAIT